MERQTIVSARKLADFINKTPEVLIINPQDCPYKNHVGAIFTDIILQAGLNYKTIVFPRVQYVLKTYPEAYTVSDFSNIIYLNGIENVINWKNQIKIERMFLLIEFCKQNNLETTNDIKKYLLNKLNKLEFLKINGIGNKTLDYMLKLLSIDTVAVDRHIFSFVEKAGIESDDYKYVKLVVEYAADIMGITRRAIDYSIWSYMSNNANKTPLFMNFNEN